MRFTIKQKVKEKQLKDKEQCGQQKMGVVMRAPLPTVRLEAGNGAPPPPDNRNPPRRPPLLSVSKPTWIVKTESNVRKERVAPPVPPCVVCRGSGRVDCYSCKGRGRTNHIELTMLPKGEWPKWCRSCGGSGLAYCARCVGTGEYRYIMGFQFMNKVTDRSQDNPRVRDHQSSGSFTDLLLNNDQTDSDSGCER